jgi:hypothetical protein
MQDALSHATADFQIRFDDRPGHLYAFVSGPKDTIDVSRRYWSEIASECEKRHISRVLVEEDFPNAISDADTFDLIAGSDTAMRRLRIAFVDRRSDQFESNLFGETVARNRGMIVKVFDDATAAQIWLQAGGR